MAVELKVTIKDETTTLSKKFLEYEDFEFKADHPIVKEKIDECLKEFHGDKNDCSINVTGKMVANA
jgi:hypothetical protein